MPAHSAGNKPVHVVVKTQCRKICVAEHYIHVHAVKSCAVDVTDPCRVRRKTCLPVSINRVNLPIVLVETLNAGGRDIAGLCRSHVAAEVQRVGVGFTAAVCRDVESPEGLSADTDFVRSELCACGEVKRCEHVICAFKLRDVGVAADVQVLDIVSAALKRSKGSVPAHV